MTKLGRQRLWPRKRNDNVAAPLAPVWVPSHTPLVFCVRTDACHMRKGDNEERPATVYKSPDIKLLA